MLRPGILFENHFVRLRIVNLKTYYVTVACLFMSGSSPAAVMSGCSNNLHVFVSASEYLRQELVVLSARDKKFYLAALIASPPP